MAVIQKIGKRHLFRKHQMIGIGGCWYHTYQLRMRRFNFGKHIGQQIQILTEFIEVGGLLQLIDRKIQFPDKVGTQYDIQDCRFSVVIGKRI